MIHLPHRHLLLPPPRLVVTPDRTVQLVRGHRVEDVVRMGPNMVHVGVIHPDGTYEDGGVSQNLLTNAGRDLLAAVFGHSANKSGAMTAATATSGTPSGGGMTTDQYKGWRVFCPVTGITTAPVYGNVGTNNATVLTIDQWWTSADGTGTTPAGTNAYYLLPVFTPRFMGVTTDAAAAAATDTTLASELAASGLTRALATYAHTGGTGTLTLQKLFNVTGTVTGIHKLGLFTASTLTAGGVMCFETVADADKNVVNGDIYSATWTGTITG